MQMMVGANRYCTATDSAAVNCTRCLQMLLVLPSFLDRLLGPTPGLTTVASDVTLHTPHRPAHILIQLYTTGAERESRALVSRCRGDVKVVSRLMSSSVSRLSSLLGCVGMSRCVELCRGLCRGVSRGHVEGLSVKVSRGCVSRPNMKQTHTRYIHHIRYGSMHIHFLTKLPHWACFFIPTTTIFLLLGCSL